MNKITVVLCTGLLTLAGMSPGFSAPPPGGGPGGGPPPGGRPGGPGHPPRGHDGPSAGEAVAAGVLGAIITGAIIEGSKPQQPPPPPPPHYAPGRSVAVQQQLKGLGYYHGRIDGKVGPQTRAAIQRYQADYRLPITGRIDPPLLQSLGLY